MHRGSESGSYALPRLNKEQTNSEENFKRERDTESSAQLFRQRVMFRVWRNLWRNRKQSRKSLVWNPLESQEFPYQELELNCFKASWMEYKSSLCTSLFQFRLLWKYQRTRMSKINECIIPQYCLLPHKSRTHGGWWKYSNTYHRRFVYIYSARWVLRARICEWNLRHLEISLALSRGSTVIIILVKFKTNLKMYREKLRDTCYKHVYPVED